MLVVNIHPTPIALAGNPVKLTIQTSSMATYVIDNGYSGSVEIGTTEVFIEDILQTLLPQWTFDMLPDVNKHQALVPAEIYKDYEIKISNNSTDKTTISHRIFPGGVSKEILRLLVKNNNNIFNLKFLNPANNLFMTTRSNGRFIEMCETEIMPLFFLHPPGELRIEADGSTINIPGGIEMESYALNIPFIRKQLFSTENRLVNRFDVYFGLTYSSTILITPGTVSESRYILEFRNSYGVYERFEVTGSAVLEQESDEESTYSSYDSIVNDYVERRERRAARDILQVQSGFKTQKELVFLIDMLASEHILLLGYGEQAIECTASADDLAIALTSREPVSVAITLRFIDKNIFHTQHREFDFDGNRIHVDQFSQHFN